MFRGIGQILPRAAARHGDKTALVVGERALTYAELERDSNRLANALIGLGVAPGDRVTLYGLNSAEWLVGYHAIAKLGAVINPINVMLTPEEVVFVTGDCEASAILIGPEKLEAFLDVARDTPVRQVVVLGSTERSGVHVFETLLGKPRTPSTSTRRRLTGSRPSATPREPPATPRVPCRASARSRPTSR